MKIDKWIRQLVVLVTWFMLSGARAGMVRYMASLVPYSSDGAFLSNTGDVLLAVNYAGSQTSGSSWTINGIQFVNSTNVNGSFTSPSSGISMTVSGMDGTAAANTGKDVYSDQHVDAVFGGGGTSFFASPEMTEIAIELSNLTIGKRYRLQSLHRHGTLTDARRMTLQNGSLVDGAANQSPAFGPEVSGVETQGAHMSAMWTADDTTQSFVYLYTPEGSGSGRALLNAVVLQDITADEPVQESEPVIVWDFDQTMSVNDYALGTNRLYNVTNNVATLEQGTGEVKLNWSFSVTGSNAWAAQSVQMERCTYIPSEDGELAAFGLRGEFKSAHSVAVSVGVEQGGDLYWSHPRVMRTVVTGDSTYHSVSLQGLTANDFYRLDGVLNKQRPDFRATGAPLTFFVVFRRGATVNQSLQIAFKKMELRFEALPQPDRFAQRRDWILNVPWPALDINTLPTNSIIKAGSPYALIKLYQTGGSDGDSRQFYVDNFSDDEKDDDTFAVTEVVRAWMMFGNQFTSAQKDTLVNKLRAMKTWAHGGTENHQLMRWTSGYLLAEEFGGNWYSGTGETQCTAAELMATMKSNLLVEGRFRMRDGGAGEYLSPNYLASHIKPLLNLYDFARDRELRDMAEALLNLHLTDLSLNVHEGHIMEPVQRIGGKQYTAGENVQNNSGQFFSWLYFGHMSRPLSVIYNQGQAIVFPVLSSFRPTAALMHLANGTKAGNLPFSTKSARVHSPGSGTAGRIPRNDLRSVYRTPSYAVGAGYFNHNPDGFYMQHSKFGIAWSTDDPLGYLQCGHHYWKSDSNISTWYYAPGSPFQQMAHHENTVLMLFNIPEADPWVDRGHSDWYAERDGQYTNLLKRTEMIFPKSVDEHAKIGDWWFLREGNVYIGCRPLTTHRKQTYDLFWNINADAVENGNRWQAGYVFEVGTEEEFGNYANFRSAVTNNYLAVNWGTGSPPVPEVTYVNTRNTEIKLRFTDNLTTNALGVVETRPQVWIDNVALDYASWPDMEGPGVLQTSNGVFQVSGQFSGFRADCSQDAPVTYRNCSLFNEDFEAYATNNALVGQDDWEQAINTSSPRVANTTYGNSVTTRLISSSNDYAVKTIEVPRLLSANDRVVVEITASRGEIDASGVFFGIGPTAFAKLIGISREGVFFRDGWPNTTFVQNASGQNWNDFGETPVQLRSEWDLSAGTVMLSIKDPAAGDVGYRPLFFNAAQTQLTTPLGALSDMDQWNKVTIRTTGGRKANLYRASIAIESK